MTLEGWRGVVQHAATDSEAAELMAKLLHEQDMAKHALREKGYGCTGMGWLETVAEVPRSDD